jgi:hypothetical protein
MNLPKNIPTKRVLFIISGMATTDELGNKMIARLFGCDKKLAAKIKHQFVLSLCKPKLK